MNFLILILLLLFMFGLAISYHFVLIDIQLDTNQNKMNLLFYWLYPMFKAKVVMENLKPKITIYLFKKKIFTKTIKVKKGVKKPAFSYYKFLVLKDSNVSIQYGLNNPFSTGITAGLIEIIQTYFNNIPITQVPDFVPSNDYVTLEASTKINVGKTLAKIVRSKVTN